MNRRAFASLPALFLLAHQVHGSARPAAADPGASATPSGTSPTADDLSAAPFGASDYESPALTEDALPVFYERLKEELTFPLAWPNARIRSFRLWRTVARRKVEELLWQPPDHTPFDPEVLDEQPGGGYVKRTLLFNLTRHSRVRAVLLVPEGRGPHPALLLLHDHGARFDIGKEKWIRPWYDDAKLASAEEWAAKYFSGRFVGEELAARGYVVLAVDALGWGDRSGMTYENQQALAANLFNLGSSLGGLLAREDARAAAFLSGLPEVDPKRVAAVGFSMGAYRAWQVAALSDAVRAAVSVCWMTGLKEMMVPGNNTLRGQSAFHMLHPGLYRYLDIPDVASIAAPKPLYFAAGEEDTLFTAEGVRVAYDKMRHVWESQGAGDRLRTTVWSGLGHVFVREIQDDVFDWLDTWVRR